MPKKDIGNLFIVAAPSGGGKTSLVKAMIQCLDTIAISISHTTRKMRPGEKNGVDYFFIEEKAFETMVANQDFIEHALVFNHYYGTFLQQIKDKLDAGIDMVLDIDWQGAQQIKRIIPNAVTVFIIPPSLAVLNQRLCDRGQDKEEVIALRMQQAKDELAHYKEFDYLIVNEDFEKAVQELCAIVVADRLSLRRQTAKQEALLSFLFG